MMISLFKKIFDKSSKVKILQLGKYNLQTNKSHPLDKYKKKYPLYDKFLQQICSNLDGTIFDIGANIGDTAIGVFAKNENSFIIGVEPDENFSEDCNQNIKRNSLENRFLLIKKFISSESGSFTIDKNKSASTGSRIYNSEDNNFNSITFFDLINLIPNKNLKVIDLIKIDTDGYDWDILESYCDMIEVYSQHKSRFVFFEFQSFLNNLGFKDDGRKERTLKYKNAINRLYKNNYNNFAIFDNFGTHLLNTNSVDEIIAISDYIFKSQLFNNTSTIYHIDILAFNVSDTEFVNNQIEDYLLND